MANRKIDITMTYTVTKEDFENLMVTALEGGIDYWGYVRYEEGYDVKNDKPYAEWLADLLWDGKLKELEVVDVEDDAFLGFFSIDRLFSNASKPSFKNQWIKLIAEEYDSYDADILFQSGVFNEVTYG